MMDLIRLVFCIACVALSNAAICSDVNTRACEIIAQKVPDFCSDPCLSRMCTRYCGHCPVNCFECHEIDDPANCTHVVTCPSIDHYCYTTQTFKDDFTEAYKLGCATKSTCQKYIGTNHRKRNIDLNGACCMHDKCNNKLPLLLTTGNIPPTNASAGINITPDPNVCSDFDDTACKLIATSKPDVCSDTCFASNICPRTCGKCFTCYTCNDIDSISDCNVTNVCQAGHECFTLETLSYDLRPVFRVGCMEEKLCARFLLNSATIFGRRDGFALKGGCCKTDLCNNHVQLIHVPITVAPTHITTGVNCRHPNTHCPPGYISKNTSCYMIGQQLMAWQQAKYFCESHCGQLVDFTSHNEMIQVFSLLVPHNNGQYQDARVWTDATYLDKQHSWIWSHSHAAISHDFSHLSTVHVSGANCAVALVYTAKGSTTTTEDIEATNCLKQFLPLCKALRI